MRKSGRKPGQKGAGAEMSRLQHAGARICQNHGITAEDLRKDFGTMRRPPSTRDTLPPSWGYLPHSK